MARSITLRGNIKAPNFDVEDIFGNRINLRNYRGKRVFVGFFRHAGCPFCNLRVNKLESAQAQLKEKNMEMVFFFESTKIRLLASKYHTNIHTIPMVADPEKQYYNLYGVENSPMKSAKSHFMSLIQTAIKAKLKSLPVHWMADNESISTIPAEFLIDENGVIRVVHYARDLTDELSTDLITQFAEEGGRTTSSTS
ncbi:MAG: peroxiredoxin-like family protein [Reichenbachiella sp.]|uniref:peroxiredoxin-like family protein n=1 Tax=Reichenbachiella sp. TaxID=2184521 RepID=UPI0032968D51